MSQLNVDNIQNRTGSNGGPNFPSGISVAVGQTAYIHGNLQVDGTETIINTETLNVADKTVGIGSTSNASNTTADGAGIEVFASSSQTGNNKTLTWGNTSNSWEFGPNDVGLKVGTGVTVYGGTGIVSATSFKGDGSLLTGIDATAIQTGNTSVQTVDTGSDGHVKMTTEGGERLRIGPAGQIGLGGANYGTSGQLLTSAGSGSAPTWTTVSSAPEYAGVASGSISAGNAVVANTDGTVSKIGLSYTALDPITILGCPTELNHPDGSTQTSDWLTCKLEDNYMVVAYKNESNSNTIKAAWVKFEDTGTATWSSNIVSITSSNGTLLDLHHDPTRNQAVIVYKRSDDRVYFKTLRRNTGATSLSTGTEHQLNTTAGYTEVKLSYDTVANKFLVVYAKDVTQSNYCTAQVMTVVDNDTFTFGSLVTILANECAHIATDFDTSAGKHLVLYRDTADDDCHGIVATVSGTSVTFGTAVELETGNNEGAKIKYSTTDSKFLWLSLNMSGGEVDVSVLTISGTSVSRGTNTTITTNTAGNSSGTMAISYEANLDVFYILYRNNYVGKKRTATISGTNVTVGSEANSRCGPNSVADCDIAFESGSGKTLLVMQNGGNNAGLYQVWTTSASTTNVTAENYLGVSDGNYTNGQLATIRVSGSTQDNQTGLTPGQNYFVTNGGELSTTAATPKVYAGTAVSATKLLVGKESPQTNAWEIMATHDLSDGVQTINNTGWSSAYQNYRVVFTGVNKGGTGVKIWMRWYMDPSPTSTGSGTLGTNSKYVAKSNSVHSTSVNTLESNYHKLYNDGSVSHWANVTLTFPMSDYTGNAFKGCFGQFRGITSLNNEICFYDDNAAEDEHIKGVQVYFEAGTADLGGRLTFLRQKYA